MKKSNKKGSKPPKINGKKSEGMTVAEVIRCILEACKQQSEAIVDLQLKLAVVEAKLMLYYEIQKSTYEQVKEMKPKKSKGNPELRDSMVLRYKSTNQKPKAKR